MWAEVSIRDLPSDPRQVGWSLGDGRWEVCLGARRSVIPGGGGLRGDYVAAPGGVHVVDDGIQETGEPPDLLEGLVALLVGVGLGSIGPDLYGSLMICPDGEGEMVDLLWGVGAGGVEEGIDGGGEEQGEGILRVEAMEL